MHEALLVLSAGVAAEAKFLRRPVALAGDDRDQAIALAGLRAGAGQTPEDVLERYRVLADAEVVMHWGLIERVAGALTRRGSLSATDVETLISRTAGGETPMATNRHETAVAREQARIVAASAAATAESQAVGGHAGMTVTLARTMVADIAASTKAYLAERMQSFEQEIATLRQRVVDLEARTYQGTWAAQTSYKEGALITYDGSLWIARSDSAGVRPGSTHCWQLAARKGADGRPGKDAA